jgi:hypothetical protein
MVLSLAAAAWAVSLEGTSRSYLLSREDFQRKLLPGYEYLDFSVRDMGAESISGHFGGWGRFDFREETGDTDIQYAFVSYKRKTDNSVVNLGRVTVFEGVAAERVDGVYARTDLPAGFGISAFGGSPVETVANTAGNDIVYGTRLSHQKQGLYAVGVSFLKAEKNDTDFRKEEGVDLWFRPLDKVELLGRSSYNAETKGWMEHAYNLILGPFDKVRLNTELAKISYFDYFTFGIPGVVSPAFRLGLDGLAPTDKLTILGEEVQFAATGKLAFAVNYRSLNYDIFGDASSYGARAAYTASKESGAGLSVNRVKGDARKNKYWEYRAYAYRVMGKVNVALDLIDVGYDEDINGVSRSSSASIAAGYALSENLKVGADVEYMKTPDFDKDIRVFARLIYSFAVSPGSRRAMPEKSGPAPASKPAAPAPVSEQAVPQPAAEQGGPAAVPEQPAPAGPAEQGQTKEGAQ